MTNKMINGLLNPIRMKIIMTLQKQGEMTIKDIKQHMDSVPQASLYRHVKTLLKEGFIEIVSEEKIRGSVQMTYKMKINPLDEMNKAGIENDIETINEYFYTFAMTLLGEFMEYTSNETANLKNDLVGFRTYPIYVTDEENEAFAKDLSTFLKKYITNEDKQGRKLRKFSFVYMPIESEE